MKKLIFAIAMIMAVGSVTTLYAQQDPAKAAAFKQKMKDDLKLTDMQSDSISAIQQEYRPKMRDIYMDQSLSQDDKKAKFAPINDAMNKRIQAVLGDDLFKKYQDWMEKNRPMRGGGGGKN